MKWCTSGVRDLWDFSADGRVSGLSIFRRESLKWDGNKMKRYEKWDGGGCSESGKAREKIQYKYQAISCFGENSPWLRLVILASNFWFRTWLYVSVADRLVSCQIWHGLVLFDIVCPQALAKALKVNKTVTTIDLSWNNIGKEGAKAWCLARGSVAPGLETVK